MRTLILSFLLGFIIYSVSTLFLALIGAICHKGIKKLFYVKQYGRRIYKTNIGGTPHPEERMTLWFAIITLISACGCAILGVMFLLRYEYIFFGLQLADSEKLLHGILFYLLVSGRYTQVICAMAVRVYAFKHGAKTNWDYFIMAHSMKNDEIEARMNKEWIRIVPHPTNDLTETH